MFSPGRETTRNTTRPGIGKQRLLLLLLLASILLLCGCGVGESANDAAPEAQEIQEEEAEPTPTPIPELTFADGSVHLADETELDLSWLTHKDAADTAKLLARMPELRYVELGSEMPEEAEADEEVPDDVVETEPEEAGAAEEPVPEEEEPQPPEPRDLSWKDIRALMEAAPDADVCYRFTLFEKEFTTLDEEMNFHQVTMDDEGAAVKEVLPCMKNCKYLDMDFTGVSSEHMAEIRDAYPQMKVVWRIWFGTDCSVRTDAQRILASNLNHKLQDSNTQDLKYCTDIRLLDIGHNGMLEDYSFLEYMPDLEVAILGITGLKDLTPISGCTKLEYLELNTLYNGQNLDLEPLKNLTNLEHLNLCRLGYVQHWEVLKNLTKLKRLFFGCNTWLPEGAREELEAALPNTEFNWTTDTGCDDEWRYVGNHGAYVERYALLREQFEYEDYPYVCSSWYNDPLYFKEGTSKYDPRHTW